MSTDNNDNNNGNKIKYEYSSRNINSLTKRSKLRKNFGRIVDTSVISTSLIKVQTDSYSDFLQKDVLPENRKDIGIQNILTANFPIISQNKLTKINFLKYHLDDPIYNPTECRNRSLMYASALKLSLEMICNEDNETQVKQQDIYIGEIPLMTEEGTFIINGVERVIVSQLHRSPGTFFEATQTEVGTIYSSRIIPVRGIWLDFMLDEKRNLYALINKKKLNITYLLMAMVDDSEAISDRQKIIKEFYEPIHLKKEGDFFEITLPNRVTRFFFDVLNEDKDSVFLYADTNIKPKNKPNHKLYIKSSSLVGQFLYSDVQLDLDMFEHAGTQITEKFIQLLPEGSSIDIVDLQSEFSDYILNSIKISKVFTKHEALIKLHTVIRANDEVNLKQLKTILSSTFFDEANYSLSQIGRMKLNRKLKTNSTSLALSPEEVILAIKRLIKVAEGAYMPDEPDSLEIRRVRSVGELARNQFQQAILKLVRSMQDKMVSSNKDKTILELTNSRHFSSVMKELWYKSPLSQQMSQTNPLSEITHKRRLSCFGAGGLNKDRPWTDVRDFHESQYGRICVSETPEGLAIGLVVSPTLCSKVDEYGFLCTPYAKIKDGKVSDEVVFLSSMEEEDLIIAHYDNLVIGNDKNLRDGLIDCRKNSKHCLATKEEIDLIDVTPKQIVSLSASLIPFIECNDATRTVMGSNMQRQALPLIKPEAPLIGTGTESIAVRDSCASVLARHHGTVIHASANKIIVRLDPEAIFENDGKINDVYELTKLKKSNDGTAIDQTAIVSVGDRVEPGDILATGAGVDMDEIALGRNVCVAFQCWRGGNFEDAILISSSVANRFSSIGLSRFEISVREINYGVEQFTREIPNMSESLTNHLDESGIVIIGTHVKPGDIIVGRVTPKGETNMTSDEKLIKAIFGSKSIDVKDTSLRVPPGVTGTVIDIKVFTKKGIEKNKRTIEIENAMIDENTRNRDLEFKVLNESFVIVAKQVLLGEKLTDTGAVITQEYLDRCSLRELLNIKTGSTKYKTIKDKYEDQKAYIEHNFEVKCKRVFEGDQLPIGVLQTVQVIIATEHDIQPGDKLAGRYGNKGIVSRIMNSQDMPYMKDGRTVDMLLTATGISGRMNIGQILETHLGWASVNLGKKIQKMLDAEIEKQEKIHQLREFLCLIYDSPKEQEDIKSKSDDELIDFACHLKGGIPFACPVFEGPKKEKIRSLLELAGCDPEGKEWLYDGVTGLRFPQKVTVGMIYMMQLHHLVTKKVHSRSVGPYSIVAQQPLGGRAQQGGQRFGEMEVWALQAYSAAYTAREMLTVKSDYPAGRARIFELISQGYDVFNQKGIPESFCVILYELRALCLNVECLSFKDGRFIPQDIITSDSFDAIQITPADRNTIVNVWSHGKVTKPETLHYRTSKPHHEGIFSTRIFGPIKDYQCLCGRNKGLRNKGTICAKCQTEVTTSKVRRYRMGHIELAAPVVHIWFAKLLPSRISIALDMSIINLNKILRFEYYAVVAQGVSQYPVGKVISSNEYYEAMLNYEESGFAALTGAEAIEVLLKAINLQSEIAKMREELNSINNENTRSKVIKRLKMFEAFHKNGSKLESMVLRAISVLPPDLRPLVVIEGGRFASSDSNELYRRVINRNNRLEKLLKYATPDIVIRNEKRMLQEAVDALFDNSRRSQPVTDSSKRPLKSISDSIKGKQGRFRQNLLGKRVDYSGRSVIVVGPELKMNQCGLPKTMALELFRPMILARLVLRGFAPTLRIAKSFIENRYEEVWDILSEITNNYVVLINRAPTLHRLGIQGFEVTLVEGQAIKLHPLVCRALNADFDGDSAAIHVPLSIESQLEARILMMSTKCIINPSNAKPIAAPAKDMVLGIYAMTCVEPGFANDNMTYSSFEEVEHAVMLNIIRYSTPVKVLMNGKLIDTTYGRLKLFNSMPVHPELNFDMVNRAMVSKDIEKLVYEIFNNAGEDLTVEFLDKLMRFGFEYATLCGATFSYSDLPVPEEKPEILGKTKAVIEEYYRQFKDGLITAKERHNKVVSAWNDCSNRLAKQLLSNMSHVEPGKMMNPIYMMATSGARGSELQLRQLGAMRGIMAKLARNNNDDITEEAIERCFIEGVTPREFVLGAQGARKGLTDITLKTANSGYLTRRLIDVSQDCLIKEEDCGTRDGIVVHSLTKGGHTLIDLKDRLFGRTIARDVTYFDANGREKTIARAGAIVDKQIMQQIGQHNVISVTIRSPVTCEHPGASICASCYGYDLSNLKRVKKHVAVGVIAAQSIGEPGTQLTMKNFQTGGAAQNLSSEARVVSVFNGFVSIPNVKIAKFEDQNIIISKNNILQIVNSRGDVISSHRIPNGATIYFKHMEAISKGSVVAEWNPFMTPIVAERDGIIRFRDLIPDVSYKESFDTTTGTSKLSIKAVTDRFTPTLALEYQENTKNAGSNFIEYPLNPGDTISVDNNAKVHAGQTLGYRTQTVIKTQDIVGGLQMIVDYFEARTPKNACILSETDGIVEIVKTTSGKKIIVRSTQNPKIHRDYNVPKHLNVIVEQGDLIKTGDMMTDGRAYIRDILEISGKHEAIKHFIDEVQSVYQSQGGILISDKHIEVVLRQMLKSGIVLDPGDTALMENDVVLLDQIRELNKVLVSQNKREIVYKQHISGITVAAIWEQESFIAAASFQDTAKVLIDAAIRGAMDDLSSMKARIMTGHLIAGGIGGLQDEMMSEELSKKNEYIANQRIKDLII